MNENEQIIQAVNSLVEQVTYLRREMVDVMAGLIATQEYVCAMAEKTCETRNTDARDKIMELTEKHRQRVLSAIEDTSPALAAFLDLRSQQDVEDGLKGE